MFVQSPQRTTSRRGPHRAGTAMVFSIILSVILTGMVISIAWAQGLNTQTTTRRIAINQAFFAAESGAQRALWQWKHNNYTWNSSGTWTMTVYDSTTGRSAVNWTQTYSCTPDATVSGAYDISCSASSTANASTFLCSFLASPPTSTNTLLAGGSNGNISGQLTVNGNYATNGALNSSTVTVTGNAIIGGALNGAPTVGGNLSVNGACNGNTTVGKNLIVTGDCNASPSVGGNLSVNGNIWGTPTVGGTKTAGASNTVTVASPPSVTSMINTLSTQVQAAGTFNNPWGITTFDFTKTTNNIILINGDANIGGNINVIGSGTIVVTGSWNQSANFPTTGTATVNIVCNGDLNMSGNVNVKGGIYTNGNWNQSGGFNITGVVCVTGNANVSGNGTLTMAAPPSFDPRSSTSGSSSITEANFSGPVQ
jgi:hypothetical protein